ncbi:SICAvar, type I (fragment) [Plasmodium knowlesi strain H]|uniref:SICAvar, type I n=1 Tax=Plasmodium knowlesi (strain H) TaxID=5851 RepID=A0A1A7W345_PLAKH
MELLCQPILEIKYFMNGIKTERKGHGDPKDIAPTIETLNEAQRYSRCIVGAVALYTIYGDHCKLKDVIEKIEEEISPKVDEKLEGYLRKDGGNLQNQLNKCEGIDIPTLLVGKALLQDKIKEWVREDRAKGKDEGGAWRAGGQLLWRMKQRCTNNRPNDIGKVEQVMGEAKENNKGSTATFLGIKSDDKSTEGALMSEIMEDDDKFSSSKLGEMLNTAVKEAMTGGKNINVDSLVQSIKKGAEKTVAEACTQKRSGNGVKDDLCRRVECVARHWEKIKEPTGTAEKTEPCERLSCIVQYLKTRDTAAATGAVPGTGGSTTPTNNFWEKENGDVAKLWQELSQAMIDNGKNNQSGCDGMTDASPSEQTACKFLHAGFKELYNPTTSSASTSSTTGDVLKNNPSFRQTMGCFLLHAYAKHMKDKAVCDIEEGIKQAFESWQDLSTKAAGACNDKDKKCIPCKWEEDNFKGCEIEKKGATGEKENVENKLKNIIDKDGNDPKMKEMAQKINEVTKLCDQVKCVTARWMSQNKAGGTGTRTWDEVWGQVQEQISPLRTALGSATKTNKGNVESYCQGLPQGVDKEACLLIAAGLKNLYDIQESDAVEASFKRTMRCVLLNAIADKLQHDNFPCKDEKKVSTGIDYAFKTKNKDIKDASDGCNDDNCFQCERYEDNFKNCKVNNTVEVKDKVEEVLKNEGKEEMTKINDQAIKDICKPCTEGKDLCEQLTCTAGKWGVNRSGTPSTWDNIISSSNWLLTGVLGGMKSNQEKVAHYCNDPTWNDDDAAGAANKTACKLVAGGLHYISSIQENYSLGKNGVGENKNPYDNQEYKQLGHCLALRAVVEEMKKRSKICDISKGIETAFSAASAIRKKHCTNNKPCIECKLDEDYNSCPSGTDPNVKIKDKLEELLPKKEKEVGSALTNITETSGNKGPSLCDRLQCLASRVEASSNPNACEFWNDGVKPKLQAMFKQIEEKGSDTSRNNTNYATCGRFGDGNTDSVERKACNHIAEGLKYIKKNAKSDNDQLFEGTVACIALNMYANNIIKESQDKCPIDEAKITQMFNYWNIINNSSCLDSGGITNGCFKCNRLENSDFGGCHLSVADALVATSQNNCNTNATEAIKVRTEMKVLLEDNDPSKSIPQVKTTLSEITNTKSSFCTQLQCAAKQYYAKVKSKPPGNSTGVNWETLSTITEMDSFCSKMQCAAKQYAKMQNGGQPKTTLSWEEINDVVKEELTKLIGHITNEDKWKDVAALCGNVSSSTSNDTPGEEKAKQKACKLFASGLKHISEIKDDTNKDVVPLRKTMMCAALNLYADQLINKSTEQCPLDKQKMTDVIDATFLKSDAIMKNGGTSCSGVSNGTNSCFICTRHSPFPPCQIGSISTDKVKERMNELLEQKKSETKIDETLDKINSKDTFCTQIQCAIKQHYNKNKNKNGQSGVMTTPNWSEIENDAKGELSKLLGHMLQPSEQNAVTQYCQDYDWYTLGHKQSKTNKAACLLFAAGLKNIYVRGKGQVKGPSFEQTMGCLFLKEYAKQLKELAKKEKEYKVHPNCSVDSGINYAFSKSKNIMEEIRQCKENVNKDCFECKIDIDYDDCSIGNAKVGSEVNKMFEDPPNKNHMQQTLENTVCPILLTDILTPFLPLAPVSIGLSAMAYYLWKYFGPLGKGGARFRRSPAEIPGPSVQEQVLDHVQQDSSHEYRLVKERKPRSVPTRTKRSGRVNRRTIIEIHFEVLDECQKGDTQLNQKDFLELLVQEFMGSEFMEEEQVPKEEVLMEGVPLEGVPMESVPMERVPSLGSGFMV